MRIPVLFRRPRRCSIKKVLLLVSIVGVTTVVVSQIVLAYRSFESGLGTGIARTAIAYHIIVIAVMIVLGVRLGYEVERIIRQEKFLFSCTKRGRWAEKIMRLWGYDVDVKGSNELDVQPIPEVDPDPAPDPVEVPATWNVPTRRGRKPTFTLDQWMPVAVQWENRDTVRDGFTLSELICEHLGTHKDGSPIISEQTYYSTWRTRAIEEMNRRAELKQACRRRNDQQKN
jgi:hypothetical protein